MAAVQDMQGAGPQNAQQDNGKQFTGSSTPDNPVQKADPSVGAPPQWDEDIKSALLELTRIAAREYEGPWKSHFREHVEAEEFWKGNHYPVTSDRDFNWRTPFEFALENNRLEDMPTYQYAINIYQSLGLSAISKQAERVPKVRWFPEQASSEIDLATAKAASKVSAYIEDKNKIKLIAIREAYLGWTQGIFGTWTRYVRDRFKHGVSSEPIIDSTHIQMAPDRFVCQACGEETPSSLGSDESGTQTGEGAFDSEPQCQSCQEPLSGADYHEAEYAEVPVVSGTREVPNGIVKMTIYGGTNLCVMPYVHDFDDSGYLILQEEISFAAVRATWQEAAKSIGPNESDAYGNTTDSDAYAKNARMRMMDAAQPFGNQRSYAGSAKSFSTVKRCWFRPWYLHAHPSEATRQKLIEAFPDGAYVAFADGQFLEAENRGIDEEWDLCYPMPGQGLYRPALGASTIPLNKQIDDGANIVAEHLDFGSAPPMFFDAQHVNPVALQQNPMRPGMWVPVMRINGGMNKSLQELFHQPQFKLDPNIYGYGKTLVDMAQLVSGVIPSMFGGPLQGNDTLGAYQQSANNAMGKFILFWQAVKEHHASVMTKAVKCFQAYETQDKEYSILGQSGDAVAEYIRLDDLQGSAIAKPETDEDYPASMSEIRSTILQLAQSTAPGVQQIVGQIFANPANTSLLKRMFASDDLVIGAESQREKTYREIDQLLQGQPQFGGENKMTGEEIWMPSVPPDVYVDDHQLVIATLQEWAKEKGLDEKVNNPPGYANVMARLLAEYDAMAAVQRKLAQVQMESMPPHMAIAAAGAEDSQRQDELDAKTSKQGPPTA